MEAELPTQNLHLILHHEVTCSVASNLEVILPSSLKHSMVDTCSREECIKLAVSDLYSTKVLCSSEIWLAALSLIPSACSVVPVLHFLLSKRWLPNSETQ